MSTFPPLIPQADETVAFLYQQMNALYERKCDQLHDAMKRLGQSVPKETFDRLTIENNSLREQLRSAEATLCQVRAEEETNRVAQEEEMKRLKARVTELSAAVAEAHRAAAISEGHRARLEQALEETRRGVLERDDHIANLQADIQRLQAELRAARDQRQRDLEAAQHQWQAEAAAIDERQKAELAALREVHARELEAMRRELDTKQREIDSLHVQYQQHLYLLQHVPSAVEGLLTPAPPSKLR